MGLNVNTTPDEVMAAVRDGAGLELTVVSDSEMYLCLRYFTSKGILIDPASSRGLRLRTLPSSALEAQGRGASPHRSGDTARRERAELSGRDVVRALGRVAHGVMRRRSCSIVSPRLGR